jgi:hypothetical protein
LKKDENPIKAPTQNAFFTPEDASVEMKTTLKLHIDKKKSTLPSKKNNDIKLLKSLGHIRDTSSYFVKATDRELKLEIKK